MKALLRTGCALLALLLSAAAAESAAPAAEVSAGLSNVETTPPPLSICTSPDAPAQDQADEASTPDEAVDAPAPDEAEEILPELEVPLEPQIPEESPSPPSTEAPTTIESIEAKPPDAAQDPLRFENGDIVIGLKESVTGALRIAASGGAEGALSYASSNPAVVRVDTATGKLYGAKTGAATITASREDGASASCTVTVRKAPKKLRLTLDSAALGAGESTGITASFGSGAHSYALALASSNEAVARVEDGRIVAVAPGRATISGKTYNKKKASAKLTVKEAPGALQFTCETAPLGVGMALPLTAAVNEGAAGAIRYAIASGAECARLDGNQLVAAAPGEVRIRAETYNGVSAEQSFAILAAPESVELREAELVMGVGEKREGALHASLNAGSGGSLRFVSSKPSVVKVDPVSGKLSAKKKGAASIRAVAYNGAESAPCEITVRAAPKKIKLSVPLKECSVGQVQAASVKLTGGSGSWTLSSANPSVIEIRDGDRLAAVGEGRAKITARSYNGKKSSATVTVVAAPASVTPERESASLILDVPERLAFLTPGSHATFRYESSNPAVASVEPDGDGTVTPLCPGEAVITATTHNGLSASTRVRVCPLPEALIPDAPELAMGVGDRLRFGFSTLPEGALAAYRYESSNPSVAKVSADGVISAMASGSAEITIQAHTGASAAMTVRVESYNSLHAAAAYGHRGASGWERENTLAAFQRAAELGADGIETDVHLTKDHQIVLVHDNSIRISKKKSKAVSSLTLEEIRSIDPEIPTLEEGLDCIAGLPLNLMIEFKSTGEEFEREVIAAVERHGMMDRTSFGSFHQDCVRRLRAALPSGDVILIVKTASLLKSIIRNPQKYSFFNCASVKFALLNAGNVRDLHLLGLSVAAWTPNSEKEIRQATQAGVDCVISNYPDRV